MTLSIDTTKKEEVIVELWDGKIQKDKIAVTQKLPSQALLPAIVKILKKNKLVFKDLTGVDVATGPGSFTGTRVGAAVANALGFALSIPVNGKLDNIAIPVYEKTKYDE